MTILQKIVQLFVESPLIWGIHVAAQSEFTTINDLQNKKLPYQDMALAHT